MCRNAGISPRVLYPKLLLCSDFWFTGTRKNTKKSLAFVAFMLEYFITTTNQTSLHADWYYHVLFSRKYLWDFVTRVPYRGRVLRIGRNRLLARVRFPISTSWLGFFHIHISEITATRQAWQGLSETILERCSIQKWEKWVISLPTKQANAMCAFSRCNCAITK